MPDPASPEPLKSTPTSVETVPPAEGTVEKTEPRRVPAPGFFGLRREVGLAPAILLGVLCLAVCIALWWYLTAGEPHERLVSATALPSPMETVRDFHGLWFERGLTRNTLASLRRVVLGFGLAAVIGVPIGILCGCFPPINAFFAPLTVMGRNIPIAALIPLTFSIFGIGEFQKVMFIFIACVAFVVIDSANAVRDVSSRYVDTAFTLGASRWQTIMKVLTPLAMPSIFNSLRLLFGLAFGYIMLAELIKSSDAAGGLGSIINYAQSRGGQPTYIVGVLIVIPLVALLIDRLLFWVQRELFPHQYGGAGILRSVVNVVLHAWEDMKLAVLGLFRSTPTTTEAQQPPAG